MPKVIFVEPDGREFAVVVPSGVSARDAAVNNAVPGIDGDCGGCCACATCHVHVAEDWLAKTGLAPVGGLEESLLQFADGVAETSRLACQIVMTDDLNGLVLWVPAGQH